MFYLSEFCCLCLQNKQIFLKLEDLNGNKSYYDKLKLLLSCDFIRKYLLKNNTLICINCCQYVDDMHNFQSECKKNIKTFHNYLTQLKEISTISGQPYVKIDRFDVLKKNLNYSVCSFNGEVKIEIFNDDVKQEYDSDDEVQNYGCAYEIRTIEENVLRCDICDKTFNDSVSRDRHTHPEKFVLKNIDGNVNERNLEIGNVVRYESPENDERSNLAVVSRDEDGSDEILIRPLENTEKPDEFIVRSEDSGKKPEETEEPVEKPEEDFIVKSKNFIRSEDSSKKSKDSLKKSENSSRKKSVVIFNDSPKKIGGTESMIPENTSRSEDSSKEIEESEDSLKTLEDILMRSEDFFKKSKDLLKKYEESIRSKDPLMKSKDLLRKSEDFLTKSKDLLKKSETMRSENSSKKTFEDSRRRFEDSVTEASVSDKKDSRRRFEDSVRSEFHSDNSGLSETLPKSTDVIKRLENLITTEKKKEESDKSIDLDINIDIDKMKKSLDEIFRSTKSDRNKKRVSDSCVIKSGSEFNLDINNLRRSLNTVLQNEGGSRGFENEPGGSKRNDEEENEERVQFRKEISGLRKVRKERHKNDNSRLRKKNEKRKRISGEYKNLEDETTIKSTDGMKKLKSFSEFSSDEEDEIFKSKFAMKSKPCEKISLRTKSDDEINRNSVSINNNVTMPLKSDADRNVNRTIKKSRVSRSKSVNNDEIFNNKKISRRKSFESLSNRSSDEIIENNFLMDFNESIHIKTEINEEFVINDDSISTKQEYDTDEFEDNYDFDQIVVKQEDFSEDEMNEAEISTESITVDNEMFEYSENNNDVNERNDPLSIEYRCPLCNKTCRTAAILMEHKKNHVKRKASEPKHNEDKRIKLDDKIDSPKKKRNNPDKNLANQKCLRSMFKEVKRSPKCLYPNLNENIFYRTDKNTIPKNKPRRFKCNYCEEIYASTKSLKRHLLRVHKILYKCKICNQTYVTEDMLVAHVNRHKPTDKPPDKPSNKPPNKSPIKPPIKPPIKLPIKLPNKLPTKLPYKVPDKLSDQIICKYCKRVFNTSSALTLHQRIHSGERPYRCNLCLKTFKRSDHLLVHVRRHQK